MLGSGNQKVLGVVVVVVGGESQLGSAFSGLFRLPCFQPLTCCVCDRQLVTVPELTRMMSGRDRGREQFNMLLLLLLVR